LDLSGLGLIRAPKSYSGNKLPSLAEIGRIKGHILERDFQIHLVPVFKKIITLFVDYLNYI